MKLVSPEFTAGQMLPLSFQADQENASPELHWDDVPQGVKSFAVAMHDPDAPTGGAGWWHWFVYNLPADLRSLPHNAGDISGANLPQGAVTLANTNNDKAYGGCMPPVGDAAHRYIFTVYALDKVLDDTDIPPNAQTSFVGFVVNAHSIDKASLMAFYERK
ncbi:MAG: YbhB/YbcL family Raf kinase inhibitor-like protein [Neisseriaceae bacterium]|nr:YbhB/YbcL family Raf kinase inhibitor-like protein [Neisseriaceae bacterium]MBO7555353.1 YbhB/YbcL family Raf kinase inhibitor-like protein [Neisseriaceae bacterium]